MYVDFLQHPGAFVSYFFYSLQQSATVDMILVLQLGKLRLGEGKKLAPGNMVSVWQTSGLPPEPTQSLTSLLLKARIGCQS